MAPTAYDILATPLPRIDLDPEIDFQQYEVRGVSLGVDPDSLARINAALVVAKDAVAGPMAVPLLVAMLGQDRTTPVSGNVVAAFSGGAATVDDGRQAIHMASFAEADLACQVIAQDALATIGAPAIPALVEALESPVPNRRSGAAKALGAIGAGAAAALPILKALASGDSAPTVRKAADEAVKAIKPRRWFGL